MKERREKGLPSMPKGSAHTPHRPIIVGIVLVLVPKGQYCLTVPHSTEGGNKIYLRKQFNSYTEIIWTIAAT